MRTERGPCGTRREIEQDMEHQNARTPAVTAILPQILRFFVERVNSGGHKGNDDGLYAWIIISDSTHRL